MFFIGPVDTPGGPHDDLHIAFDARSRAEVDAFVAAASALDADVLHEPVEARHMGGAETTPG